MTDVDGLLFNPRTYDPQYFDEPTRRLLRATIDFFEGQGKHKLVTEEMGAGWPTEFVDFVKREKLFATFLTPAAYGGDDPAKRWDGARNHALSEILGFYGMAYWYTEQVTILGLGPIWQSANEKAKLRAAADLDDGQVMAFGLSERAHGADVYQTDMILTPADEADQARGIRYRANGTKYYIGNGNVASMVSVFGKFGEGAELGEERVAVQREGHLAAAHQEAASVVHVGAENGAHVGTQHDVVEGLIPRQPDHRAVALEREAVFGEGALLPSTPRTASAVALSDEGKHVEAAGVSGLSTARCAALSMSALLYFEKSPPCAWIACAMSAGDNGCSISFRQRERIVGKRRCGWCVTSRKIAFFGGSSSVFKSALKALFDNIWTSSMI